MKKIAITTDSNSGLKQSEVKGTNIFVLPMPFLIDGNEYFEDINLTVDDFFKFQLANSEISTSQPSITSVETMWREVLQTYDYVLHIPMSSSLSSSCDTARMIANEQEFAGKVFVVDNQRISVTQKQSIDDAQKLIAKGYTPEQIVNYLMDTKKDSTIYIMVPDLKYLKKGGRITKTAAAIGTLLKIKPVLQIQGGKLDSFAKVMSIKVAKEKMISAIKKDIETRFSDMDQNYKLELSVAYTYNKQNAEEFANEVKSNFPNLEIKYIDPLSLSVSCHIGPNAIALAMSKIIK